MRTIGIVLVLAACGGGKGGGDVWDVRVDRFAEAICRNTCVPADVQDDCFFTVQSNMDAARQTLGPQGEPACIDCMQIKIDLTPQVIANGCDSNANLDAMVFAICDLDDNFDFDGDGDPGNDFSEACAGSP